MHDRQPKAPFGSRFLGASLHAAFSQAANLLFPPTCALCAISIGERTGRLSSIQLCSRCLSDLTIPAELPCPRCARPLPKGMGVTKGMQNGEDSRDCLDCPRCRGKRFRFDRTYALGVYGGILREAVLQMKQATGEALTLAMGNLLGEQLSQQMSDSPDFIVSVPTHWTRRLSRNVNCPEILLESAAKRLGTRSSPRLLSCKRKTDKQGTLLPNERLVNVRGAYRVSTGYAMNGARVLLVDDVMTTGATANEIAKILRRSGAANVEVAVIARGIGFDN